MAFLLPLSCSALKSQQASRWPEVSPDRCSWPASAQCLRSGDYLSLAWEKLLALELLYRRAFSAHLDPPLERWAAFGKECPRPAWVQGLRRRNVNYPPS